MSQAEWSYLLNSRSASTLNGVSNARYSYVKIQDDNNVITSGLMVYPDVFAWPTTTGAPSVISASNINAPLAWTNTSVPTYSASQWRELEDAGCVFLPAKGRYNWQSNTGRFQDDGEGFYWTSTPISDANNCKNAYYLHITQTGAPSTSSYQSYAYGCMVRLVYAY